MSDNISEVVTPRIMKRKERYYAVAEHELKQLARYDRSASGSMIVASALLALDQVVAGVVVAVLAAVLAWFRRSTIKEIKESSESGQPAQVEFFVNRPRDMDAVICGSRRPRRRPPRVVSRHRRENRRKLTPAEGRLAAVSGRVAC